MKDLTILMTGAGAPGAPGIISCYRNNGERKIKIIGVDMRSCVPTDLQLDSFEQVPSAANSEFIGAVLNIAKKYHVDVIQPLVTRELELFSEKLNMFAEFGINVCVSSFENLVIANDKGKLLNTLSDSGIAVPSFSIINETAEFREACKKVGYPEREICFKPTKSNGSRGFRIVSNRKNRGELLFNEKPSSTYITYEEAQEIFFSMPKIPQLLVMEYLPGDEYSVDLLVDNGTVRYCIPRLRTAMNGGISTRCTIKKNNEVICYCNAVAENLKLNGNIGIQVRYDCNNEVKILEINPRLQGSIVACAAAGANLPYYAIKQIMGESVPKVEINWDVEMVRYWKEVYFNASGHAFTF